MTSSDPSLDTAACPFCGMVRGEVEAHRIYSDPMVFAILDRRPINPYHLLVIPTVHVPDFYDLDDAVYAHLMRVARRLAGVVKVLAAPTKVGLLIAGFDVAHTHVHVIPDARLSRYHVPAAAGRFPDAGLRRGAGGQRRAGSSSYCGRVRPDAARRHR